MDLGKTLFPLPRARAWSLRVLSWPTWAGRPGELGWLWTSWCEMVVDHMSETKVFQVGAGLVWVDTQGSEKEYWVASIFTSRITGA